MADTGTRDLKDTPDSHIRVRAQIVNRVAVLGHPKPKVVTGIRSSL